nr:transposase, MuDR, MULE transposase domain protein [Tanacetum cinerariifolium]
MKGKHYGIQPVKGSPYEAFEMLPYYCYNLEKKNEGTVTRIKTDDNRVFEMLFIAIGASIRTFLNYLRPVLMIDAAHLKGLYKRTNLVAVAMDGNNQIVSIAFGICKGETGPCWSWWMSVLKECIGDNLNFLFISDRHAVIALAVENEFPLAFHAVCCRHLMMNLGLKNKKRKGLFWKICKAYRREDYTTNMNTLQTVQPDAHEKLCRAGPQRCKQSGKKRMKSATWVVNGVNAYQYEVSDGQYIHEVNLQTEVAGKLHIFVAHTPIDLSTVLISNDGSFEQSLAVNVRLTVFMKPQESLDEETILEKQMLALMHRFADRFVDRRVEINNLIVLHDHPLIDYGKYALGCITGAGMKKCVELKGVRDELLRSMEENRQLITNYKDM